MNKISFALLFLVLTSCGGPAPKGEGRQGGGPGKGEEQAITLDDSEVQKVISTNGRSQETVVRAVASIIEIRSVSGQKLDTVVISVQRALDERLSIQCASTCEIKERENVK
jgi:hypothetical protein